MQRLEMLYRLRPVFEPDDAVRKQTMSKNLQRACALVTTLGFAALMGFSAPPEPKGESLVYFGTYTGFKYSKKGVPAGESHSQGIYVSRFQAATGEVSEPQLAAEIRNPSFLAVHPNRRFLYSVSEDPLSVGPYNDKASFISAYAINTTTGKLTLLNTVPSGGTATCYISMDPSGKYLMAASFGSGSVAVFRVNEDGSLGEATALVKHTGHSVDPHYQAGPHAHSLDVSPDGRFAVASDLGADRLFIYRFDSAAGSLTPNSPPSVQVTPPGAGPRHFIFAPDGKFGYVISEMSGIVTVYAWDSVQGRLTEIQATDTRPADFTDDKNAQLLNPFHSAEMQIHPNGKYLYESNRGPDTIGVYGVDPAKGTLTPIQQVSTRGLMPRHFAIDPTGAYLFAANEASDGVVIFRIEDGSGRITPTRTVLRIDTPVCVKFLPLN
jgi:6-phosphogluconolactonase